MRRPAWLIGVCLLAVLAGTPAAPRQAAAAGRSSLSTPRDRTLVAVAGASARAVGRRPLPGRDAPIVAPGAPACDAPRGARPVAAAPVPTGLVDAGATRALRARSPPSV